MMLAQLRTRLLDYTFDLNSAWLTTASANAYLNSAMRHVCALASGLDRETIVRSATFNVAADNDWWYKPDLEPPEAVQILRAKRTNAYTVEDTWLEIITPATMRSALTSARQDLPKIMVWHHSVVVLQSVKNVQIMVDYIPVMWAMIADDDKPGMQNGYGANIVPEPWQEAIVTYATILALTSEKSDSAVWRAIFNEQLTALGGASKTERPTTQRS